jgi:DNA-binding MarR family transcriptional regulator
MIVDVAQLIGPDPRGEFAFEILEYTIQAIDRIARIRERLFEQALVEFGLSIEQYRTLVVVAVGRQCRVPALAVLLGYEVETIRRACRALIEAELVTPTAMRGGELDAVAVTTAGAGVYAQTVPIAERINDQLVAGLSDEAQRATLRGLEQMLVNLGTGPKDVVKRYYALQLDLGSGESDAAA